MPLDRDALVQQLKQSLAASVAWTGVRRSIVVRGACPDDVIREYASERANNIATWLILLLEEELGKLAKTPTSDDWDEEKTQP